MIEITGLKDKAQNPAKLPNCETIEDFKKEWINQGHKVISHNTNLDILELESKDGKKFFCIVIENKIFPFSFS